MSKIYPLEWLDSLILQTFNPEKTNLSMLSENDLSLISENVLKESQKIQFHIKNQIFTLRKKREIRLLVRKYHSTLIFLLDSIIEHQKSKAFNVSQLSVIVDTIVVSLDELLSFVENRFSYYLSLDERVPVTYLMVAKKEMLLKLNKIGKNRTYLASDKLSIAIVINMLSKSIESGKGHKITFRQILYQREVIKGLESLNHDKDEQSHFSALDEILIGLNFNCSEYINSLTDRFSDSINSQESKSVKLNTLMLYYKEFNQLLSNENITFDVSHQNIKYVLDNWFRYEIAYMERQVELSSNIQPGSIDKLDKKTISPGNKIECILSTDQLALILRAGDESRILKARSMSQVFKTIVPYLSTPQKKDLSYDSMRSKAYVPEERDKEIAIKTLERIIKHIREY